MAEGRALEPARFGAMLEALLSPTARGIVMAVSGGPDSMAMMHLAAAWQASATAPPLTVATVDHGLRAGSSEDAAHVMAAATALGVPVRALSWSGHKPARAIQERARAARYALLLGLCEEIGADHLVTAHTLDDQAETVLFRLMRGSGVGGLGAMRRVTRRGAIMHLRPLLETPKADLVATCVAGGIAYRRDPGNVDPRFARTRVRALMPRLAAESCDAAALARLADRAARADEALEQAAATAFSSTRLTSAPGTLLLDGRRLLALAPEIALRVLARAFVSLGGSAPRLDALERLAAALAGAVTAHGRLRRTLGGHVVSLGDDGHLSFAPEGPRRRGRCHVTAARAAPAAGGSVPWQA